MTGADNQQERLDCYIAGYVDGEGSFSVSVQRNASCRVGYQLVPEFHVSQNADRAQVLELIKARLGCGYITRQDNAHAKAGNINNALRFLSNLPQPPEFISILDADFVPAPLFLKRGLTLFRDEKVGIVQTPQHFINPDPIQSNLSIARVWPDEQRYFFDHVMAAKDAWGASFCCGTSSVISNHGAFEPTKMCPCRRIPGSLSSVPAGTSTVSPMNSGATVPQVMQNERLPPGEDS